MKSQEEIKNLAKGVKVAVFDGDGVIFSGQVFVGPGADGTFKELLKVRSHLDGQGLSLIRSAGIRVAVVTAEKSGFAESLVNKLNNLPSAKSGAWPPIEIFTQQIGESKLVTIETWLKGLGLAWSECAYMGDDVGDFQVMQKAGFKASPAQAESLVKNISDFVAPRQGGNGAVRDFCNFLLETRGIDPTTLNLW